ncbi:hydantoinase/oxoprolinase family protein [Desulfosporosinus metallidurans]|uniref:hydantoinase/oxoprolinase family protein n=1 Tax=Desulfosporosinus metallidurans TaxID=1888891 RepID=UPI001F2D3A1D|nr:hydantoinase/oxoprolinase family protein [Desulfosporosinus metallidurans]
MDKGGMLRVGPHSAGAKPGPACYGLGGQEPTITDAAVIMGLLDSSIFLGGRMALDEKLAYEAIETKIAQPLGLSVPEAAYAIYQVALSLMVDAVYLMTVKKGYDPRLFALAAVGGALLLFATALAAGVGIQEVVVPELAPVFCAQGLHHACFQIEVLRSLFEVLGETPGPSWNQVVVELQRQADQELSRLGVSIDQREYVWSADLKYPDQHHEINTPLPCSTNDPTVWQQLARGFHENPHRLYGYSQPEKPLELVNLRLLAKEKENSFQDRIEIRAGLEKTRETLDALDNKKLQSVYLRGVFSADRDLWQDLNLGMRLRGPALKR